MIRKSVSLTKLDGVDEAAATQLLTSLREKLTSETGAILPGIGRFSKTGHTISFEPDPVLLTEVNAMYAGLHPLLLVKSGTSWVGESDAAYVAPPDAVAPVKAATTEDKLPPLPPEVPFYENTRTPTAPASPEPKAVVTESAESAEMVVPTPTKIENTADKKAVEAPKSKKKTSSGWLLVAAVATAAVLTSVFLLNRLLSPPDSPVPGPITVTVPVPIVPPIQKDSVVQPTVDEMAVKTTAQDTVAPVIQTTESASLAAGTVTAQDYGLQQPFNTSLKTWFALVVHSLDLPEKAEIQRLLLEKSGFRVAVQQAVVNEKNVWRVGIGQFEKVEDALRASADLPEPFKNRYFVKRFSQ